MTTSLGEQPSTSYPAEGEMVGIGARRKNLCRSESPSHRGQNGRRLFHEQDVKNHHQNDFVMTQVRDINSFNPQNNFERRFRRIRKHVYDEIDSVRSQVDDLRNMHVSSSPHPVETESETCKRHTSPPKPVLPPKPSKYVLRDKRLRHVYQTINLLSDTAAIPEPPPLPEKPFYLRRFSEDDRIPPPLPPRVPNKEAIKQRHKLDVEYFENLRRNVDDGGLLDLAEEGDLPVPFHPSELISAAVDTPATTVEQSDTVGHHTHAGRPAEDQSLAVNHARRHSMPGDDMLPNQESGTNRIMAPNLPPRASSVESTLETGVMASESCHSDATRNAAESTQAKIFQNLLLLKQCGWYWGNMTWQEAEALLAEKGGEGAFLMRDSQNPLHLLTLTVRSAVNTIHHIRVEYSEGKFQLYEPGRTVSRSAAQCARHSNVEQFIKLAMKHSKSGSFLYFVKPRNMGEPPIQIRLLTPVSRLSKIKSLQYNCRMVIRNCVVADLVSELSVPTKIKDYLLAGPYYDSNEEHELSLT